MKAIFFCYDDGTATVDKFLDQIHIASVISFLVIIFLDWSYWKAAPYSVHTLILHGIVFTFLFLRFCQGLDFRRMLRELSYAPRLIVALLAGLNAILCNIVLLKCQSNYPDFLRLPYFLALVVTIAVGYAQLAYFAYAMVRVMTGGAAAMMHHEMQEEEDYKGNSSGGKGSPIKGHLKEQKEMGNQRTYK